MVVVRGYWRIGLGDNEDQVEVHKTRDDNKAASWRDTLNKRGCPVVTVTYE